MIGVTWVGKATLVVGCAIGIGGMVVAGVGFTMSRPGPNSPVAIQHRIDLLEQDVGHLEQRVVRVENVLAEVLAVETTGTAKAVEAKAATAETKASVEQPVSVAVPPAPPVQVHSAKRKPVARHPASQRSEYPQTRQPYPWSEWENPAP